MNKTNGNNKLIAEFMGFTQEKNIGWYDNDMLMSQNVYDSQYGNCFDELLFHTSWDWLMPVIHKIRDYVNIDTSFIAKAYSPQYEDYMNGFNKIDPYNNNLEGCYKAVVEFIKECD